MILICNYKLHDTICTVRVAQKQICTNPIHNVYLNIISVFSVNYSGMVCIQDDASSANQEEVKVRLASLSSFQLKCLNHGLRFPRLKRLVYSTCSIHSQENEEVIAACLQQNPGFRWLHLMMMKKMKQSAFASKLVAECLPCRPPGWCLCFLSGRNVAWSRSLSAFAPASQRPAHTASLWLC